MPTFKEVCLVVATEDGARGARFTFTADRLADNSLDLDFHDALLGLDAHARLSTVDQDLVVRRATLRNDGARTLTLERALSAALPLPPDDYDLVSLHGQWGREFGLQQRPLLPGRMTSGSTRGFSSHEAHPWFAVRPRGDHDEHRGRVWFGSLAWSGNWLAVFDVERNDALNVVIGIQPFDFGWRLEPGATFSTPELVCGCHGGRSGRRGAVASCVRGAGPAPGQHRERLRPVLYNSWEATHFDVQAGPTNRAGAHAPPRWAWNCSSSTTAGSARATTTAPGWAIG